MSFEPEPGARIDLNNETIEFVPLDTNGAAVFVYAESGREGTVYKVLKNNEQYALKVFYPEYRDKRLFESTEKLSRFRHIDGFRVAERTVITQDLYPEILDQYPDLNYAILMPWVEGTVWGNLMLESEQALQPGNYFQIVKGLTRVVGNLEIQGLAHCDLSNNNFIIAQNFSSIQLIDIENMYAPNMPRPMPDISYGTIGYRTRWIAENGLWGPESDRFAFAILCSEIFAWHYREIRENKAESTSFFEEDEIGETSERFNMMKGCLGDLNQDLVKLFEQAWFAKESNECPLISDWMNVILKMEVQPAPTESEAVIDTNKLQIKTLVMRKTGKVIPSGVPPKMEISHEILDFGEINKAQNTLEFSISNTGGAVLKGRIVPEKWLDISDTSFSIKPGGKQQFKISITSKYPIPQRGFEYRTASAVTIDSNAGGEVISASYRLSKPRFYQSAWKRTLAGIVLGFVHGLGLFLINPDILHFFLAPVLMVLCGLAGLITYPHRFAVIFPATGFFATGISLFIFLLLSGESDYVLAMATLGAYIGSVGGAIGSRILFSFMKQTKLIK